MEVITTLDFEKRLQKLGINNCCPKCHSPHFNKVGKRNHIQVYRCKDCSSQFTVFLEPYLKRQDDIGIYGLKRWK